MLHSDITIWDLIWIFQTVFTVIAIFIAYKKGDEHGFERGRNYKRRGSRKYELPVRCVSPEEFLEELDYLERSRKSYPKPHKYRRIQ